MLWENNSLKAFTPASKPSTPTPCSLVAQLPTEKKASSLQTGAFCSGNGASYSLGSQNSDLFLMEVSPWLNASENGQCMLMIQTDFKMHLKKLLRSGQMDNGL